MKHEGIDQDFIKQVRQMKRELRQPYGGWEYVPMGEARSMMVPVTLGCDYNACLFCDLNRTPFYEFSIDEITESIKKLAFIHQYDRRAPKRAVLLQGNPFCLKPEKLLKLSKILKQEIPTITEIACFARVQDVLAKSHDELISLRNAGFVSVTLGIESGSDQVLRLQNKGVTCQEQEAALNLLTEAGIDYDVYLMLGLGGKEFTEIHAQETARLINKIHPKMLIIVTTVLFKGAKLRTLLKDKRFVRLSPLESMEELLAFLKQLDCECIFNATHKTNYFSIKGVLPEAKEQLVSELEGLIAKEKEVHQAMREARRWRRFSTEK